jgi:hypothetical protein
MPGGGSKPGERRGGRKKGTPNKLNGQLKEMILEALDNAGGVNYLVAQSKDNPTAFLSLVGKVLPMTVAGTDGGPVAITVFTGVPRDGDD